MKTSRKQSTSTSSEADKREFLRSIYRQDLYAFAKQCLGYSDTTWKTHGETIECLERKSTRKLIVLPRGSFKSSLGVVAYPLWVLIKDPNARILIDSEVYTNSKNFIREIKGHIESKSFIDVFGDWKGSPWSEGEITVKTRTKVLKEASITASGIGAVKVGQHYTHILMDDMNSANNSDTPEMREKVIQHYRLSLAILEPGGTLSVTATRYAVNDIPGLILDNEIDLETRQLYVN